jgi:N-acetylmuramoyl-L-alanine amidase
MAEIFPISRVAANGVYLCKNCSNRQKPIDHIYIHNTTKSAQSAINTFLNKASRVSIHFLIDKEGKIYQLLDEVHQTAWHIGKSELNHRSIGIEVEASQESPGMTAIQEHMLRALVISLCEKHKIDVRNVVLHRDSYPTACPSFLWKQSKDEKEFLDWKRQNLGFTD